MWRQIGFILVMCIGKAHLDLKANHYKSARLTSDFISPVTSLSSSEVSTESITTVNISPITTATTTTTIAALENGKIYGNSSSSSSSSSSSLNQSLIISQPEANSGGENRLRWVDSGRHQGYPPYIPNIPGIPSGFRNPLVTQPSLTSTMTMTTTTTTTTTEASIESLGTIYNTGTNHNFLAGSSSNTLGFVGSSAIDDELLFNTPASNLGRFNITRVEHIVAECSDEYMKVVVRFNGTFTGLIYSSGYVHDPKCIYVNGSGRNHYEFFIRLNQCGTLGRQEMYHPSMPGEARRRDHLMWNTLSIQYNSLIEEEFDEHFRLTCEYGSDFWKTVSFPSVNVEINTGSPVVFTINPPQCQMEIRRGFGIAGTRTTGPVTVGDPLTLLIHMKSDKVGFDILVKNCIAHNGAQQRLQLIDSNGCVTNDKLISPFRGTYKAENGHQVSLFAYLKAFRFTGSLALYLECDIHMCHNRCPPQRCYWRNLSKRSAKLQSFDSALNSTAKPILSESISLFQALEVHHDQDELFQSSRSELANNEMVCLRPIGLVLMIIFLISLMSISLGICICYCLRMKKLKYLQRSIFRHDYKSDNLSPNQSTIRSTSNSYSDTNSVLQYPYRGRFCRFG